MTPAKMTSLVGSALHFAGISNLTADNCCGTFRGMRWFVFLWIAVALTCSAQVPRVVVAIAHRGEHLHHPENTLPAFAEAIRVGADFFELDVRTTSDGKLILSHDEKVDRCTTGHGKVSELTLAELRALDAGVKAGFPGTKMPTFDEALELARASKIGIYVDVKNASAADLVSHIEAFQMSERVVIYCGLPLAKQLLALNPILKVMPEAFSVERAKTLLEQLHPKVLAFDKRDFTPDVIALAKAAGVRIYVDRLDAADTPEAWQAAVDAGADGIQTDRPRELVEFLRAKGYR